MTHLVKLDGLLIACADGVVSQDECASAYETFQKTAFYRSEVDYPGAPYKSFVNRWCLDEEPWASLVQKVLSYAQSMSAVPLELKYALLGCALYGEQYVPHHDSTEEGEITALLYLNPEWKIEWYGETMFYSRETPEILSFLPAPGRVLMFDGRAYHRVGIPSRDCPHSRATLVLKLRACRTCS